MSSLIHRHTTTYPFISPSKYTNAFHGKVVLLTGASRGIGRATALAFAAAGASVACTARTSSSLTDLVSEIASKGFLKSLAIPADISDPATPAEIVKEVEAALGPIDILINNAGILYGSTIEHDPSIDKWWKVMETNVRAPMALIHAVLPSMIARNSGTIISVSSDEATKCSPGLSSYAASKAAITKAHEIIDLEFRPHGVTTFSVHPGAIAGTSIASDINIRALEANPELQELASTYMSTMTDTTALAADTMVALAADPEAKILSGKFVNSTQDLGQVIAEAKKGTIEEQGLYRVGIRETGAPSGRDT